MSDKNLQVVNENINNEITNAEVLVETLNQELEEHESTKASIEQYLTILERNREEPFDYFSKTLLNMGMEHLGYPISLDDIEGRFNGGSHKQQIAVAVECLTEQLKMVVEKINTIKEISPIK